MASEEAGCTGEENLERFWVLGFEFWVGGRKRLFWVLGFGFWVFHLIALVFI